MATLASDDLNAALSEVLSKCAREGMRLPFIVVAVSPNGSVLAMRVGPTGDGRRVEGGSLMNVLPNWRASSTREFVNVLHSRPQEIEEIDALEFTGLANTQQN
jgi:hypothetical protein